MERIKAILSGKIEDKKIDNKINRIKNAIEACKLNMETDSMGVEEEMTSVIENSEYMEASKLIASLVDLVMKKNNIAEAKAALKEVEKFLSEDVKVEATDDKKKK